MQTSAEEFSEWYVNLAVTGAMIVVAKGLIEYFEAVRENIKYIF
jgi:hypothetical protein